ncbi:MAG TPA: glycosyltransferase family 2 protein [Thermoplasmata archaeon]|nr:glycosyltransferase family 2 protein [Thermoplasmata archaeon]
MRATLLVPTLNEAASIGHVLDTFRAAAEEGNARYFPHDPIAWEVVVIDGHSHDGTAEIARGRGARVIDEPRKGYGRAYRTGFAAASGEVLATVDGDATYPSEEVPRLVRYLLDRNLDFLTCDRLSRLDPKSMTREHRIGNWALNRLMHLAYHRYFRAARGATITDSQSGMWVFRRSVLDRVRLTQDGMAMSEELKLEVVLRGVKFEEVPIHYAERWGAPKLSSWRDGRENLQFLLTKRLEAQRELHARPRSPLPRTGEPAD